MKAETLFIGADGEQVVDSEKTLESIRNEGTVKPLICLTEDEVQNYTHLKDEEIKKFMGQLNSDIWVWIGEELSTFQGLGA